MLTELLRAASSTRRGHWRRCPILHHSALCNNDEDDNVDDNDNDNDNDNDYDNGNNNDHEDGNDDNNNDVYLLAWLPYNCVECCEFWLITDPGVPIYVYEHIWV